MPPVDINYLAVLVAAALAMAVGALWYSPVLFARQWMKAVGKKAEDLSGAQSAYMLTAIGTAIAAYVLAHWVDYVGADTWIRGAETAVWAWVGFVAPLIGINFIFEGKSRHHYLITVGHHLVALLIMGAVLGAWQ
jgi:hypothetical protein